MKHTIEINEEQPPAEGTDYPRSVRVFHQTVNDLDIPAVIAVVNNLIKKRRRSNKGKIQHANLT